MYVNALSGQHKYNTHTYQHCEQIKAIHETRHTSVMAISIPGFKNVSTSYLQKLSYFYHFFIYDKTFCNNNKSQNPQKFSLLKLFLCTVFP